MPSETDVERLQSFPDAGNESIAKEKAEKEGYFGGELYYGSTTHLWKNTKISAIIAGYSVVGSQLSVVNKIAVSSMKLPTLILLLQFVFCVSVLGTGHIIGLIEIKNINSLTVVGHLPFVAAFYGLLSCGIFVLKEAPLETFIAFKATTPIFFSLIEYLFMGRMLPSTKALGSMVGIIVGALWYVSGDVLSNRKSYLYCLIYIIFACIDGVIAKDAITRYHMNSWSRTFLLNLLAIPIGLVLSYFSGELCMWKQSKDMEGNTIVYTKMGVAALLCSCIFGVGMGLFTMLLRDALSATSVSVIGTCNKFLTEIINYCIWSNHASLDGAEAVFFIIICGIFYEQSPLRSGESKFNNMIVCSCLPLSLLRGAETDEDMKNKIEN